MSNYFKRFDSFGTVVGLHFGNWQHKEEGRSPAYKTSIGGIFSILNKFIFFVAFMFYFRTLIIRG